MEKRRRAAAVLLTRDRGRGVEVYLIERSKRLRFFGGYWALPGGVIDPILDASGESGQEPQGSPDIEQQHARCAQRELFEETGVLLGPSADRLCLAERAGMRRELRELSAAEVLPSWRRFLERTGFRTPQLAIFAELLTPPFSPLRYETSFHHATLPPAQEPRIDGQECVAGDFFRPQEVLERWTRGEFFVVPPTLHLLRILAEKEHAGEWTSALRAVDESCQEIARGLLYGACQSPGISVAPLRTPTVPPATTTNTFLVGGENVYVIDPATPYEDERRRLFAWCDGVASQKGRRIAAVLLTHHHADHVGSAREVALRYGVPVGAHPLTHGRLDLGAVERLVVNEGDRFGLGTAPDGSPDWHLRALFTPGHAPGHLAFIESYLSGAIVGDLVSTLSTIVIDPPDGHMATYLASLQRLIDEDIRVLHPAHGLPQRSGVEIVRNLLAHRAQREARLLAALGPSPRSVESLLEEVYDDVAEEQKPWAQRSLLAGLEKAAEEGRARSSEEGWSAA